MSNKIIKKHALYNKAQAYIDGPIGSDGITAEQFKAELAELPPDCELDIIINSSGGSVEDGFGFYKPIRGHQGPTTAYNQGICASIASVIAMACDTISMASDALVMIHEPHWSASQAEAVCSTGNQKLISIPRQFKKQLPITVPTLVKDKNASVRRTLEENRRTIKKHRNLLKDRKKLLAESKESILDVYVLRTCGNRSELAEMMQAETWFTASDAVQFGFADFITAPTGLVDQADFSQFRNPTNFLSAKYLNSAKTARAKRQSKVNRKQVSHMRATVQKILTQRQTG